VRARRLVEGAAAVAHRIRDTGEGIAAEHLEKIWEPSLPQTGRKGTGLEWHLRRIVEDTAG